MGNPRPPWRLLRSTLALPSPKLPGARLVVCVAGRCVCGGAEHLQGSDTGWRGGYSLCGRNSQAGLVSSSYSGALSAPEEGLHPLLQLWLHPPSPQPPHPAHQGELPRALWPEPSESQRLGCRLALGRGWSQRLVYCGRRRPGPPRRWRGYPVPDPQGPAALRCDPRPGSHCDTAGPPFCFLFGPSLTSLVPEPVPPGSSPPPWAGEPRTPAPASVLEAASSRLGAAPPGSAPAPLQLLRLEVALPPGRS